jgi:hypothetical protein
MLLFHNLICIGIVLIGEIIMAHHLKNDAGRRSGADPTTFKFTAATPAL